MKNYSEAIKCKDRRWLTAKGNKFVHRCIRLMAEQRGYTRYHKEIKEVKDQLRELLYYLLIDEELSIDEVKGVIVESLEGGQPLHRPSLSQNK